MRLTSNATAREWQYHLSGIGRQALRGQPVEIADLPLANERIEEASKYFLEAIDSVLSSATNPPRNAAPGLHEVLPLETALATYMAVIPWCIGASFYMNDGSAYLEELMDEVRAARDVLRVLSPAHWPVAAFVHETTKIEERVVGASWRSRFAAFSLLHDDSVAKAA